MRLISVYLRGFRCYKEEVRIDCNDFTALVGRNDSGKSSVLEALDIFFNSKGTKPDVTDVNVALSERCFEIGCVFEDVPTEIVIDDSATTNLSDEYLLNRDGNLEIIKQYSFEQKSSTVVFLNAFHPSLEILREIPNLNITQLRTFVQEHSVDVSQINRSKKNEIRKAIWRHFESNLQLNNQRIQIGTGSQLTEKGFYERIGDYLPMFRLFKSDRRMTDSEQEVQDPMRSAVDEALLSIRNQLEAVKEAVKNSAVSKANATLAKLQEMDNTLASQLNPEFSADPSWGGIFKLAINDERGISVNKRGSGVRRLILLNFFRAKAEEAVLTNNQQKIIYAFEEPETSQHPSNQKKLIKALQEISRKPNFQVIITTHTPSIGSLINVHDIRHITSNGEATIVKSIETDEDLFASEIVDSLGILPNLSKELQVIFSVEGPTDVEYWKHISKIWNEVDATIPNFANDPRIAALPMGGSTLEDWIKNDYLKALKSVRWVGVYDSDNRESPSFSGAINTINSRMDDSWAMNIPRKSIENYLSPTAIQSKLAISVSFGDWDDVPEICARTIHSSRPNMQKEWDQLANDTKKHKKNTLKRMLSNDVIQTIDIDQLKEIDPNNDLKTILLRVASLLT